MYKKTESSDGISREILSQKNKMEIELKDTLSEF